MSLARQWQQQLQAAVVPAALGNSSSRPWAQDTTQVSCWIGAILHSPCVVHAKVVVVLRATPFLSWFVQHCMLLGVGVVQGSAAATAWSSSCG
jgi:hypothetical protein